MESGSVIFLTKRPFKFFHLRTWISGLIDHFQGAVTHTAIVYQFEDVFYVREMDVKGNRSIEYYEYLKIHEARVKEVIPFGINIAYSRLQMFNRKCHNTTAVYDFSNLLFFQVFKGLFSKKETKYKRICSEDTARMYNILDYTFSDPENVNPQLLYDIIKLKNARH